MKRNPIYSITFNEDSRLSVLMSAPNKNVALARAGSWLGVNFSWVKIISVSCVKGELLK